MKKIFTIIMLDFIMGDEEYRIKRNALNTDCEEIGMGEFELNYAQYGVDTEFRHGC